jgi:hypothetical protein
MKIEWYNDRQFQFTTEGHLPKIGELLFIDSEECRVVNSCHVIQNYEIKGENLKSVEETIKKKYGGLLQYITDDGTAKYTTHIGRVRFLNC